MRFARRPRLIGAVAGVVLVMAGTRARSQPPAPPSEGDEFMQLSLEALLRLRVTSATGGLELESDLVPANMITFSRDEIVANGWQSVAEALEHVPGLYLIDDYVLPSVSVRGISGGLRSGSRIVKVMINGVEVSYRPDLTAMLGPEYIPFASVLRIEVARGPLSALYGANAFLATVNIVTRDPAAIRSEASLRGSLRTASDAALPRHASGGVSGLYAESTGRVDLLLAVQLDHADRSGIRVERTFDSQNGSSYEPFFAGASVRDLSRPIGLYGQVSAQSDLGTTSLQGGLQRLDAYGEFRAESVLTHHSRHGINNLWSQAKHEAVLLPSLTASVAGGYSQGDPIGAEELYLNTNRNSSYHAQLGYQAFDFKTTLAWNGIEEVHALFSLDGNYERHEGFNYRETIVEAQPPHQVGDQLETRPALAVSLSNLAPALQIIAAPLPDLRLSANGRLDLSSLFERQLSWRAGVSYRLSRALVAKLITGHAFQAPSPVLLYGHPGFGVANSIIGSKSPGGEPLAPQTVQSAEAVLSALPSEQVSIIASVFWQKVEQKIEFLSNAVGYRARNRRTETDLGAEITVRGSFGRFAPHLAATTHEVLSTDELKSTLGEAPAHYPRFWGLGGLRVAVPEAHLNLNGTLRWVGARGASQSNAFLNGEPYTLPAYTHLDLVLSSDGLELMGDLITRLTLGARNLLGDRHSEPGFGGIDIPNRGRTFFFEWQQSF